MTVPLTEMEAMALLDGRARFGQRLGLDTMRGMLAACGDFHRALRVVHVAGTNGKGSVCAMVASALQHAGHKVGLYTSPHLVRFTERIVVDGREIAGADLARAIERVRPALEAYPEATYFEVATLAALRHFVDAGCDIVVLEVGLGGRLDATNVLDHPLVTVITNISLEHTDVLGKTEEEIAREKAGIVKAGAPLVTGATDAALGVIRAIAAERGAPLSVLGDEIVPMPDATDAHGQSFDVVGLRDHADVRIPFLGAHQVENAALAVAALDLLDAAGVKVPEISVREGLARTRWPGRLERIEGTPTLLLDGAHNPAGAQALAAYLASAKLRPVMVFGALADKDWRAMVEALAPCCRDAIVTRVPSPRACDPQEVARMFSQMGVFGMVVDDPAHALRTAEGIAGKEGLVLVTGSLYLVGDMLARLDGQLR
ncbi:MAG TPA: folylpolyglutamate synthase/dihydrofolate synthase family protein [Candidatus Thermoplasmatota archaeon]|nr:folylpolyglutamate synthase/dihydrofolate synthase family protein [Candidatus Thermoplasmatota archaeon]